MCDLGPNLPQTTKSSGRFSKYWLITMLQDMSLQPYRGIAQNIALRLKVEQLNDEQGFPLMRLNVDFARAWATLQKAIENSELNIITGNPEDSYFEIEMSRNMRKGKRQGLLAGFIRRNSDTVSELSSIKVRLVDSEDGYNVVVDRGNYLEISAEFAQDFLSVLRENVI